MSITCNQCGTANADSTQFCRQCGAQLYPSAPQPQQNYQVPPIQQTTIYQQQGETPVSILGWIGYMILFAIPLVNLITIIVILCSSKNKTLKNFVIAEIIIAVIGILIAVLIFTVLGASFNSVLNY